jgi:nicotinamide-nucleotide amidase
MTAHIISIGDELLIGQTVNTNAAAIGEALASIGLPPAEILTVGDDRGAILRAFERSWREAEVVVVTGGLGPTRDDITRDAVCRFFGCELVFSEPALDDVRSFLDRLGRPMLDAHRDQAMVPSSAAVMRNPNGTAPGYHFRDGRRHFFVTPGVPWEMRHMLDNDIVPALRGAVPGRRLASTFCCAGIPESLLAEALEALRPSMRRSSLAFLPSEYGVRLRLTTVDDDGAEEHEALRAGILRAAGEFVYGEGDDALSARVGALLRERGATLAVAESCSGGRLAGLITETPGSSAYFERGVVAYSNASKTALLGVPAPLIARHGAVSPEVAMAMADGIRSSSGAAWGLSTTGIAGPDGGSEAKPVGTVWIAVSGPGTRLACLHRFGDHRNRNATRAAQGALDLLRRRLLGLPAASLLVCETWTPK